MRRHTRKAKTFNDRDRQRGKDEAAEMKSWSLILLRLSFFALRKCSSTKYGSTSTYLATILWKTILSKIYILNKHFWKVKLLPIYKSKNNDLNWNMSNIFFISFVLIFHSFILLKFNRSNIFRCNYVI